MSAGALRGSSAPSVEQLAAAARRQEQTFFLWALLLAILTGAAFALSPVAAPVVVLGVALPFLLWRYPTLCLYLVLASACLFEVFPRSFPDEITGRIPVFWNINSVFQTYARVNLKAVPLNALELMLILAGICSVLRAVYTRTLQLKLGPLAAPIGLYLLFVCWGLVLGMGTGGDYKTAVLREARTQFYFGIAYLLAVNLIKDQQQLRRAIWLAVLCIGLKGTLYTIRRYITLRGQPISEQGVGSHEEVFFFGAFVLLLACLWVFMESPRLMKVMLGLLPLVMIGNFSCNRRSGIAALAIALPFLLLLTFRALPERRKLILGGLALTAVIGPLYYEAFKERQGILGMPARAIKSKFNPDARDAASNAYREQEDANLMATIKLAPVQGQGYGKRMVYVVAMADISDLYEYWDVLPHNSVLWVWMRLGTGGFLAFWLMACTAIIYGCRIALRRDLTRETRALGMFSPLLIVMWLVIGLYDMLVFDPRGVLFCGIITGLAAVAPTLPGARLNEAGAHP